MDEELISKKDLLEITEISYGQLYRWKRKNLIPEDWFIKKSSYTGQETFFPKDKVLERIDKIKNMKDDVSLDELAQVFSPDLKDILLKKEELIEKNIVSPMTIGLYEEMYKTMDTFSFDKILYIYVVEKFLQSGEVSTEEGKKIYKTLEKCYINFDGKYCDVIVIRKFGVAITLLISVPNEIYLEDEVKLVLKVNASQCIEELKSVLIK